APCAANSRATCEPINPVAPVTKALIIRMRYQKTWRAMCPPLLHNKSKLIQLFCFDLESLARLAFFPILAHPRFPALAGGGVAAAEGERCDVAIGDRDFIV